MADFRHRTNAQAFWNNLRYFDEAILQAWSLKIACYFYTDISGDSNGNFGGEKRGISDCRVWSILKNCASCDSWAVWLIILVDIECIDYSWFFDCRLSRYLNKSDRESRFFNIVCRSQGNSSITKAKHYSESLRISKQTSNTLTGFTLHFCRNYSLRVDTGVRVRIFCKCRNIEIL